MNLSRSSQNFIGGASRGAERVLITVATADFQQRAGPSVDQLVRKG